VKTRSCREGTDGFLFSRPPGGKKWRLSVSQMGEADRGISGGDAQCDMASSDSSDMTMAPCIMHPRL
jgi:hypothetical protein